MIDIDGFIKITMKTQDKIGLNAFRNLKAEIQKVMTAKNAPKELNDKLQLQIISKYARKLEDSINQLPESSLRKEYEEELRVIKELLPKPVDKEEIVSELLDYIIRNLEYDIVSELKLPKKEMGKAIKYLKDKFPTVDGKIISEIVKKYVV